jgi:hypothetical protein
MPHAAIDATARPSTSAIASRSTFDAGARPDAVLGEMAAERARAGHAVKRADEMPRHRMQPRALRELARCRASSPRRRPSWSACGAASPNNSDRREQPPRLLIGRPPQHHAIDMVEMRFASATLPMPPLMMMGTSGSAAFSR